MTNKVNRAPPDRSAKARPSAAAKGGPPQNHVAQYVRAPMPPCHAAPSRKKDGQQFGILADQAARSVNAASRKRLRSRSPLPANFRMRSASVVFCIVTCVSGGRQAQASSRISLSAVTVSGSNDTRSLSTIRYLSRLFFWRKVYSLA